MFGRLHHVGFVVTDLAAAERHFDALGYRRRGDAVSDNYQRAELLFLSRPGAATAEPLMELICPLDETARTHAFTTRNQFQIHHLCYATDDLERTVAEARAARFTQVQPIVSAPAIGGSRISFFYARPVGLFEVVERPPF
jgi:catechol 2,3-dioxygenase-like lactoylglutathione lyase family enzyme